MRTFIASTTVFALSLATGSALAAEPWVERKLTLGTGHADIEAGLGLGQFDSVTVNGDSVGHTPKLGAGTNLEAAVGLPFFGELRVRSGLRFAHDPDRNDTAYNHQTTWHNPDFYGRLFDHETTNMGYGDWANPEISLRGSIVDLEVAAVGLETRVVIPADGSSRWSVAPGLPLRFRIPTIARIDTGIYAPFSVDDADYIISVPAQLWFQIDKAFLGPMTGLRYMQLKTNPSGTRTDITAGVGGGYTLAERIDLKAQVYVARINDSDWSKTLGLGVGVGLLIP